MADHQQSDARKAHQADTHSLHDSLLDQPGAHSEHHAFAADADARAARPGRTGSCSGAPGPPEISAQEQADAFEQAEDGIEANDFTSDDDQGYESDGASTTSASLASSARNFIFENGRRYHAFREGSYSFPNDDREQDREDLKHAMYLKLFNGTLHFAPLDGDRNLNAIDLGTGTGIWAIDFADLYPSANVLGIDLSPIQTEWVPANLKFMVDDAEDEWLHPRDHFDYIHTRHTVQGFRNWPKLMQRALRHLKPGGWMECQEIDHMPTCHDNTLAPDDAMLQYWQMVTDGLQNVGVPFRSAPHLKKYMEEAGFVNVTERIFYTPIGPWPKNRHLREVGLYWRAVLMEGLEAIALGPMTRGLGWNKEEIAVYLARVRKAYLDPATHSFMPFYIIHGQKPEY
ncbi:methyltransferase domain-containing protein [Neofusicoccum parvum]|uniref:Methyltransferase domain-containing protein n=1 Tax=Neofusicoccum parvum TaxID=310453 RepID=A0ACB5SBE7_9PEZI|nr:methyltransferase domain-containing protein [Neofusicoccum parvum]